MLTPAAASPPSPRPNTDTAARALTELRTGWPDPAAIERATVRIGTTDPTGGTLHAGQYPRYEGDQAVLIDVTGPGILTRLWTPDPHGTLHFHFDGAEQPDWSLPAPVLFDPTRGPFREPFVDHAEDGSAFCRFPIVFAQGLRVTVSENLTARWEADLALFPPDHRAESWWPARGSLPPAAEVARRDAVKWLAEPRRSFPPGTDISFDLEGEAAWSAPSDTTVEELRIELPSADSPLDAYSIHFPRQSQPIAARDLFWPGPAGFHSQRVGRDGRTLYLRAPFSIAAGESIRVVSSTGSPPARAFLRIRERAADEPRRDIELLRLTPEGLAPAASATRAPDGRRWLLSISGSAGTPSPSWRTPAASDSGWPFLMLDAAGLAGLATSETQTTATTPWGLVAANAHFRAEFLPALPINAAALLARDAAPDAAQGPLALALVEAAPAFAPVHAAVDPALPPGAIESRRRTDGEFEIAQGVAPVRLRLPEPWQTSPSAGAPPIGTVAVGPVSPVILPGELLQTALEFGLRAGAPGVFTTRLDLPHGWRGSLAPGDCAPHAAVAETPPAVVFETSGESHTRRLCLRVTPTAESATGPSRIGLHWEFATKDGDRVAGEGTLVLRRDGEASGTFAGRVSHVPLLLPVGAKRFAYPQARAVVWGNNLPDLIASTALDPGSRPALDNVPQMPLENIEFGPKGIAVARRPARLEELDSVGVLAMTSRFNGERLTLRHGDLQGTRQVGFRFAHGPANGRVLVRDAAGRAVGVADTYLDEECAPGRLMLVELPAPNPGDTITLEAYGANASATGRLVVLERVLVP